MYTSSSEYQFGPKTEYDYFIRDIVKTTDKEYNTYTCTIIN